MARRLAFASLLALPLLAVALAGHASDATDSVFVSLGDDDGKPHLAARDELGAIVHAIVAESAPKGPDAPQLVVVDATVPPCDIRSDRECTGFPATDTDEMGVSPGDRATFEKASREPASIPCPALARVACLSKDELATILGDRDWDAFYRRFGRGAFARFSPPLLSGDGSRAIVYVGWSCGRLCGHGQRIVLERRDGTWVVTARAGLWVS